MVNIKQAHLFALAGLVLLGLFLLYWLQAEFKLQKDFLKNEIDLQVDKEAFGSAIDSVQIELSDIDSLLTNFFSSFDKKNIESINVMKNEHLTKENFEQKYGKFLPQLSKYFTDSSFDTITVSMEFEPSKISTKKEIYVGLNKTVFYNISPQLFFALATYSLILLAMYFFRRTIISQEALNVERNNLISNLTHELKTPVATIAVALEAIKNFGILADKEKTIRYITNAQTELNRLTKGINEMLKVSKLNEDNPYYTNQMVVLNDLCANAIEAMSPTAKQANVKLNAAIANEVLTTYGEVQHLQNVIINLLDNAIKYKKTTNAKVDLFLIDAGENIQLEIVDNGLGIDKKYHQKIFDRFYRVTEENIHNVKGYGLGLSYVKKVLDAHNAEITLDSALDKGSKFSIIFKKNIL